MVAVWNYLWSTSTSEFQRHGMLHCNIIYDAGVRCTINRLFPMAYEQRFRPNNVFAIFCIRCRFTYV